MLRGQYTQEEMDREKKAYLSDRVRKEDRGFGVHRRVGRKADMHPLFTEDCPRGLMQWWYEDVGGAKRCIATQCLHHGQGAWACPVGRN